MLKQNMAPDVRALMPFRIAAASGIAAVSLLWTTTVAAQSDPIPALVGAQTVTRTTPNTASDLGSASLIGNGNVLVATVGGPTALTYDVNKTDFWADGSTDATNGQNFNALPMRVGTIVVGIPSLNGASYSQVQDLYNGEIRSTFVAGSAGIVERARVLATSDNLIAIDLQNTGGSPLAVTVNTVANQSFANNGATTTAGTASGGVGYVARTGPTGRGFGPNGNAFRMRGSMSTVILGATPTVTSDGAATASSAFIIPAGATVTVVTQVVSTGGDSLTNTPADPVPTGNAGAQAVTTSSLSSAQSAHTAWWNSFWHASSVNLPAEPLLMRFYYGGLYVVASSSRAGKVPAGLFGWNGNDNVQWSGAWSMDYNFEAPYYGIYSSNHPELGIPYYETINSISALQADAYAAARGFQGTYFRSGYAPQAIFPERDSSADWGMRTDALEASINFLKDYSYTLDTNRLSQTLYPLLRKVADFWDAYLVKDSNGRYVVNSSNVAEGDTAHQFNPVTAIAYLHTFYAGMLRASTDLGVDASRRAKWQDILTNLATFTTVSYQGRTVISFSEDNPSATANPYPYNLYGVHPADQFGATSPWAPLARATIATQGSYWTQGNSFPEIYPAAVKAGYPAAAIVAQMNGVLGYMGQNDFYEQPGGGIETAGAIEAVNAMLLGSTDGALRFFWNWTGSDASFTNLRAVGAFTASATLTGGVVQSVAITSEKGQPLTVQNPWPGKDLTVTASGGGTVAPSRAADLWSFATTAGTTYTLAPVGGLPAARTDLATYRDATASSSHIGNGWSPAAALDGDTRTVADSSMGWSSEGATGSNHSESFVVDMRGPAQFDRVVLTPRTDAGQVGQGFPIDMTIDVSTDGATWTNLGSWKGIPQPTAAQTFTFPSQAAQFVRITGTNLRSNPGDGNQYRLQFAEVSIPKLIRIASASSSIENADWGVAKLVNGTTTSTGGDMGWTSSASTTTNHSESVTIDTGSATTISGVVLYPRTDSGNFGQGFPIDYTVAVSNDATNWTTVATQTGQALPSGAQSVGFTAAQARYVRITGTNLRPNPGDSNQYRMQFAEITLF